MEIRNCRECGKMFNYTGGMQVCPICIKKMDEKFNEVKQYIYDNPGAGIQKVSDEMEVPVKLIKKWVREERLTFAADSGVGIDCERCGKAILSGRFCKECKNEVSQHLDSAYDKPHAAGTAKRKDAGAKMRFLSN